MQWLRDPQRDSREDIRAAQQALVYAGYPHADAVTEVTTHPQSGPRRPGRARATPSWPDSWPAHPWPSASCCC